jgi:hypothetical protein
MGCDASPHPLAASLGMGSLAQKSRAWAAFFGPMGRPGPQKHGPTAYSVRSWVVISKDFGKAQPESPTAWQETPHSGWAWADIFRLDSQAGPSLGHHVLCRAFSWPGLTRPDPAWPEKMPRYTWQHRRQRGLGLAQKGGECSQLLFAWERREIYSWLHVLGSCLSMNGWKG